MKGEKWVVPAWRPLLEAEFLPMVLKITFRKDPSNCIIDEGLMRLETP